MSQEQTSSKAKKKKYMTLTLGPERFAIPLSVVKEVIGLTRITPVPEMPSYFRGLINLRGKVISTVDLRDKLGLHIPEQATKPCIVICDIGEITLGTIVDEVNEVCSWDAEQIEADLNLESSVAKGYLEGVAKFQDKPMTLILNLEQVLRSQEIEAFAKKQAA
jgi:purine-binding chemotaxis protein CheW